MTNQNEQPEEPPTTLVHGETETDEQPAIVSDCLILDVEEMI